MPYITTPCGSSSRTSHPFNPDQCRRAGFARDATIAAFGRHARALDQADFVDVAPNWRRLGRVVETIVNQVAARRASARPTIGRLPGDMRRVR